MVTPSLARDSQRIELSCTGIKSISAIPSLGPYLLYTSLKIPARRTGFVTAPRLLALTKRIIVVDSWFAPKLFLLPPPPISSTTCGELLKPCIGE